ncbi:Serine/threonine protein kinase Ksp1 [Taphrina deformans PYCC 5710]|uniref:non-specific serine/threonine protein kinase n=1 Tax=Taphrina deformans (strain PYCC 5710 / ATCC 11124 / CBS 356.35 / IMI 108563 / JCM 9778 / NBRC 8474) TaxID=1097556 RepID=R4XI51_TAPDE|nr:Serine/threonine protein kinase Ksp1 [Taphrina deformans PYCC 5710]|eukprot:CCG83072.2 Serine/threonine protein kinase Ksp1 [Taphrina deformans PYCC 5710]
MSRLLGKGDKLGGWDNKKYLILSTLNHGSYGTVYAARNARTLNKVAIKQISKDTQTTELDILTRLRKASSRNIIKLIDSFSDDKSSYIVNDFCTLGDLYEVIAADRVPVDSETLRDLILQLIQSVEACHSVGVYHRDVKPENIFLTVEEAKSTTAGDGEVVLKLGDFGLATCDTFSTEIGTGSDRYMAPEQFALTEAGGYDPAQADIWALGIVIMNTLFSRNPWKCPTEDDPVFKDFLRDPESLFEHFSYLTHDTFNVVKHALKVEPELRSLDRMRTAVMEVLDWTQAGDSVESVMVSRRASTNLADYDTMGPTAGRAPLRTPSIMQTAKLQSTVLGSFPWSKALAGMKEDEKFSRNGLGFAKPALKHPSMLASSWRKPTQKELGSIDSGLGASLTSCSPQKHEIPRSRHSQAGFKQFAQSAPGPRIKFPEPSPNKGHLKFGTSWADQDSDSEDEMLSPVWSNRRKSAIQEEKEEAEEENGNEIDRRSSDDLHSSFDEVAFFDIDDVPHSKTALSTR